MHDFKWLIKLKILYINIQKISFLIIKNDNFK